MDKRLSDIMITVAETIDLQWFKLTKHVAAAFNFI